MKDETPKLTRLHEIVIAIKNLSIKIDNMKKEREVLVDEFKRVKDEGEELNSA
jgi:allophanate hydrolase subunit 1